MLQPELESFQRLIGISTNNYPETTTLTYDHSRTLQGSTGVQTTMTYGQLKCPYKPLE